MNQSYSNFETQNENDLGYGQLLAKLWHRRLWFAGVFTGVMAFSVPSALVKQPVYHSYMQILVEPNYQKDSNGNTSNEHLEREFTDTTIEIDYATQLRVFKSSKILNRVAEKLLALENSDDKNSDYEIAEITDYEITEITDYEITEIIEILRKTLTVSQLVHEDGKTQTKIIQADYVGGSPVETKRVLEVIQGVYLEYNLEQQEKRLRDGLIFIDNQIPKAQNELRKAEAALTELSKKHNLISPEEDAKALKENIRQIAQERDELQAQQSNTKGTYTSIQQQLGLSTGNSLALSRLSQSSRYQNLLNKLQETEILLATQQQKFTNNNPVIQSLIDERDSQRALLIEEAEKVLGEIPPNFVAELESLPKQGQLVGSDTSFINKITESQSNLTGIRERDLILAQTEAKLKQQLVEFPELIAQYKSLTQEAEVKRKALQRLLEAKQELEIELNRGGFNWQVIEQPQLGIQIAPNLPKDLLLSLVVASFLGVTAAFVREAIDQRINNPEEINAQTSIPILGTTPGFSPSSYNRLLARPPFLSNSQSTTPTKEIIQWQPFREALDLIYENLKLSSVNSSLKTLAITSAVAGEGKSTFILGLALSVARHEQRVLVIDADLRCPSLHQPFNLNNHSGLANYLAGETDRPVIEQVSFLGETIDLITSGSKPADPVKLLSSAKLQYFIEQQEQNYDLILVDTPPAIGRADAIKVASICNSAVLMMRLDKVKVSELLEATALLSELKVLGIVANDSKEATRQYETQFQYLLPQQV